MRCCDQCSQTRRWGLCGGGQRTAHAIPNGELQRLGRLEDIDAADRVREHLTKGRLCELGHLRLDVCLKGRVVDLAVYVRLQAVGELAR